jgi:four helix bundle protein
MVQEFKGSRVQGFKSSKVQEFNGSRVQRFKDQLFIQFIIFKAMKIERFEDLEIWKDARELCKYVFEITSKEQFVKDFKFRDQIRASAGSVMDNIAEGFERGGNKEFAQFLYISKGSCGETRSQGYRAFDFKYITEADLNKLITSTITQSTKIANLIKYLKSSDLKGAKYH